jgi:outer membrane immunogenic protein
MKRWMLAGALAFAAIGQAFAADLPPAPQPRAPAAYIPVVAPVYNWGGVYIGINAGYGFGKSEWTTATAPAFTTGNFSTSGYVFGPTVGANIQADAFVFGVEGDFDAAGLDGKSGTVCVPQCETKNKWLATLRARAGYAADRVLFYGTAGGAFGNISANTAATFQSVNKGGWTAGAGVEVAFSDNWTGRIEYLFVDLQNASFTPVGTIVPITVKSDANLVRVGLDYKFR